MNPAVFSALVRHLLTLVGGSLFAKYNLSGADVDLLAGAIATLIGVAWSIYDKHTKSLPRGKQ